MHATARLQKRFPQTFPNNPAPKVPLKLGIFEDLIQRAQALALTEAELREAIRNWCHGIRYLVDALRSGYRQLARRRRATVNLRATAPAGMTFSSDFLADLGHVKPGFTSHTSRIRGLRLG